MKEERSRREADELAALALPVAAGGRGYLALPGFGRVRWLLPAGEPEARWSGMRELFRPSSAKGRVLRAMILSGAIRGGSMGLEEEPLTSLEAKLAATLGEGDLRLAFYVGTPGAYRKVTALALTPEGETLAFAKIAASPAAKADVEAEHRVLSRLAGSESLEGRVPKSLGLFDWRGAKVFLTSKGPPRPGPGRLSRGHVEFCTRLFLSFTRETTFGEGPMARGISEALDFVGARLPDSAALLRRAHDRLDNGLGPVTVPLSMAHRDFAPWNTRLGPQGLYVFDWDGAQEGVTPLYDLFHFQAIQAILRKRKNHLPDERVLRDALDRVWPEGREHLSLLYLAYLLDIALHYGRARAVAPEAGDALVWNQTNARIKAFLDEGSPL